MSPASHPTRTSSSPSSSPCCSSPSWARSSTSTSSRTTRPSASASTTSPPRPADRRTSSTTGEAVEGIEGTWVVADGSIVGYRIDETLFGQDAEAVGRSEGVTGEVTIEGTTVTDATFEVDMTTFESGESRRDGQFEGRIMEVDEFPTATFVLTEPIELGAVPADGEEITADGHRRPHAPRRHPRGHHRPGRPAGRQHLRGRRQRRPITFADYDIDDPERRPGVGRRRRRARGAPGLQPLARRSAPGLAGPAGREHPAPAGLLHPPVGGGAGHLVGLRQLHHRAGGGRHEVAVGRRPRPRRSRRTGATCPRRAGSSGGARRPASRGRPRAGGAARWRGPRCARPGSRGAPRPTAPPRRGGPRRGAGRRRARRA